DRVTGGHRDDNALEQVVNRRGVRRQLCGQEAERQGGAGAVNVRLRDGGALIEHGARLVGEGDLAEFLRGDVVAEDFTAAVGVVRLHAAGGGGSKIER